MSVDPIRTLMVMPTRRTSQEARSAWRRLVDTATRTEGAEVFFLDGTPEWQIEGEIGPVSGAPTIVNVVRRASGDAGFDSVVGLPVTDIDRVMFFHDDDVWHGVPNPNGDISSRLIAPIIPIFEGSACGSSPTLLATQHVLFGSIRGDLFRSYQDFLSRHPRPSGALDWALRCLAVSGTPIDCFCDYTYEYDIGNWASERQSNNANQHILGDVGWDFSDSQALSMLVVLLDSLALLDVDAERRGGVSSARAVSLELLGPPFRGFQVRRLLKGWPWSADQLEPAIRRLARARLRHRYLSGPYAANDRRRFPMLHAFVTTRKRIRHSELTSTVVPALIRELPEQVQSQLAFWQEHLNAQSRRIDHDA